MKGEGERRFWFTCCVTCKQITLLAAGQPSLHRVRMSLAPSRHPVSQWTPNPIAHFHGTCADHTRPHHTRDGDIRMGEALNRWGRLTPDSSDYSPIKNLVERGWWDGSPRMLRSARRSSRGPTGIDPCHAWAGQPISVDAPAAAAADAVARQAGRQEKAWQVASRPPAGWAGQPMVGYIGLGGSQKASKRKKVNRLQPVPRCLCLFPRGIPSCRPPRVARGLEVSCCDTGTAE